MSSFVIDRDSFLRVGALVGGIAKATKGTNREMWMYDYDKQCNMGAIDYVQKFAECYNLNVESVCKQYGDCPEKYIDNSDVLDRYEDWKKYFRYGKMIVGDTLRLMDAIWDIVHFSRSVSYQIEDPVCNQIVMEWFNAVISKLVQIADLSDERNQWGHFSLDLDKEKALD